MFLSTTSQTVELCSKRNSQDFPLWSYNSFTLPQKTKATLKLVKQEIRGLYYFERQLRDGILKINTSLCCQNRTHGNGAACPSSRSALALLPSGLLVASVI